MSRLIKILWLFLAMTLIGLAACNIGGTSTPSTDPNLVYTEIWLTVAGGQTETALAIPPADTPTLTPQASPTLESSNTPLISATPEPGVPTVTSAAVVATRPGLQQPCNNAEFVEDVTFPDGEEVAPDIVITKTWRFKNLGPCTWDKDYRLIFSYQTGGTNWNEMVPVPFNKIVLPGETIDISVKLKVPHAEGGYGAWYRLQTDQGINFGDEFAVYINVVKP